jgi:serine/threonine-protein kinase RsbW
MFEKAQAPPGCGFDAEDLVSKLDEIVQSDVSLIDATVAKVVDLIRQSHGCSDLERIDLALREALANAIVHGNHSNHEKSVRVCLAVRRNCDILIIVKDAGPGFNASQLPDPLNGENLLAEHGRGIFLINQLMDDVRFTFNGGTSIYMKRSSAANSE